MILWIIFKISSSRPAVTLGCYKFDAFYHARRSLNIRATLLELVRGRPQSRRPAHELTRVRKVAEATSYPCYVCSPVTNYLCSWYGSNPCVHEASFSKSMSCVCSTRCGYRILLTERRVRKGAAFACCSVPRFQRDESHLTLQLVHLLISSGLNPNSIALHRFALICAISS